MAEPNLLLYLLLGAVQGLVEWFPLSSSGQISLTLQTAGVLPVEALSTALWIHFGSLLAIVVRFRSDFLSIIRSTSTLSGDGRTGRFLVVGTIFTALTGIPVYLLFFEWFSNNPEGQVFTLLVGVLLVITGAVLVIGSRMAGGMRRISNLVWLDGALTGMAQGFAVLPGISRSGFTVAALLGRRLEKADALKLSFLLDVPAILGAMVLTYEGALVFTLPMAGAVAAAFVVSYYAMTALIDFAKKINLSRFCLLYGSLAAGAALVQIILA